MVATQTQNYTGTKKQRLSTEYDLLRKTYSDAFHSHVGTTSLLPISLNSSEAQLKGAAKAALPTEHQQLTATHAGRLHMWY